MKLNKVGTMQEHKAFFVCSDAHSHVGPYVSVHDCHCSVIKWLLEAVISYTGAPCRRSPRGVRLCYSRSTQPSGHCQAQQWRLPRSHNCQHHSSESRRPLPGADRPFSCKLVRRDHLAGVQRILCPVHPLRWPWALILSEHCRIMYTVITRIAHQVIMVIKSTTAVSLFSLMSSFIRFICFS